MAKNFIKADGEWYVHWTLAIVYIALGIAVYAGIRG